MAQDKKITVIKKYGGDGGGMVYCLGVIGALFYYIPRASNFMDGVWGVIKALLWPAFVVYELLKFFQL